MARVSDIRLLYVGGESDGADTAVARLEDESSRITVETATSAAEGVERLRRTEFDCVVSEYDIPGGDGLEFLGDVRETDPEFPFVLFTGDGDERIASEAIGAGVTDYVRKDDGSDQYSRLVTSIQDAVGRYRRQQARQRRLAAIDGAQTAVAVLDEDDEFVSVNEQYARRYGYDPAEMVGDHWRLVWPDAEAPRIEDEIRPAVATDGVWDGETTGRRADGTTVSQHLTVSRADTGELVCVVRDPSDGGDEGVGERLKTRAMDAAPVGITISDPAREDNPLVYANDRFESLTGYDSDAVVGRNCRFLQGVDTDPERVERIRTAIEAEEPVTVELRNYRRDGSEFWNRVTIAPITDENGTVTNYVGFQKDVTQRKEVEQRLQALFSNAPFAIALTEFEDGRPIIREVNPAFERTFGRDSETVVGRNLDDLLVPGDEQSEATEINKRVQDGNGIEVEVQRDTAEGMREFILHGVPVEAGAGSEYSYAIYQDITDRVKREQAVERLHSTVQSFMQAETAAEVAEIAVEAARDILDLPSNAVHLYDDREQHLAPVARTGQAAELVGEAARVEPGEGLAWRAFETGEVQIFSDVSTASGRRNPDTDVGSELILPLDDQGVLIIGSDATGAFDTTDISFAQTLAAHMTTALNSLERQQQLERQNERLESFLGIVSHDLRSPLGVAQGRLELAAEECASPHLDDAANAIDRSLTLVNDLLTLAREGEQVNEVQSLALGDTVVESWQTVATADATLRTETEQVIQADPGRLQQLLENLLRNAVEHGGDDVTITIGDLDEGFYVADDGPGIAEPDREQVFEPGYSTTEQSTGFGLNIVQEVVAAHGWEIRVTDSESGGARFEITGVTQPRQ